MTKTNHAPSPHALTETRAQVARPEDRHRRPPPRNGEDRDEEKGRSFQEALGQTVPIGSLSSGFPCGGAPLQRPAPAASRPTVPDVAALGLDRTLASSTRGVELSADGEGKYLLRFEVAAGRLEGTKISVSSDHGQISAVLIPPELQVVTPLEQALETAQANLRDRGIDVVGVEVRQEGDRRPQSQRWRDEESEGSGPGNLASRDEGEPARATALDYVV